jgi:hypothetical protein
MPGKHTVQHYHLILHTQKTSSGDLIVHSIASHYTDWAASAPISVRPTCIQVSLAESRTVNV